MESYSYVVLIVMLFTLNVLGRDIGFPETDAHDANRQNANNRKPLYIPGKCKGNQLYYPGDQEDDWICDCAPGYLFYPSEDKCFLAFRRGPCPVGRYLILEKTNPIPECVRNPCVSDRLVILNGQCYQFGSSGPCESPELSNVVGLNTTSLEIECVNLARMINTRFDTVELPEPDIPTTGDLIACPKGCRRAQNGTCKAITV